MKTITIQSDYQNMFDLYGLELITGKGVVQFSGVYVRREDASHSAKWFLDNGWLNLEDHKRYKVYQVNIVDLIAYC